MKRILIVTIALAIAGFARQAQAQKSTVEKILLFGAGYFTGQTAHEAGHYLIAYASGTDIRPTWNTRYFPPLGYDVSIYTRWRNYSRIAAGGFLGEFLSSEIIFATSDIKSKDGEVDYFLCGWIMQTILSPIGYTILDRLDKNFNGDLRDIEFYSNWHQGNHNRQGVEVFIVGHALMNFSRLIFRLQSSPVEISSTPTSVTVSLKF